MIYSGLVSVTFRHLAPRDIVSLVAQSRLDGIEWGGDVHVPHGGISQARTVRRMTADASLQVAAYGSYYRVGDEDGLSFGRVLETAVELGTPLIRVWAGCQSSQEADPEYRRLVVRDSVRIGDMAAQANVIVAFEFHGGTLTDSGAAARALLQDIGHPNVRTCWQPTPANPSSAAELVSVLPWLTNLHVFHWHPVTGERLPLAAGAARWKQYLRRAAALDGDHFAMLEFVRDDNPRNFLRDAAVLRNWLMEHS